MRKLQPRELAALVAVMAIGNTVGHAFDEGGSGGDALPTITVEGTVPIPETIYVLPEITVTGQTVIATPAGTAGSQQQATVTHAISCASAYGGGGAAGTPAAHTGPRPGWKTYYVSDYGWHNPQNWLAAYSWSSKPPVNAGPWTPIDGLTSTSQQTSWIYGLSTDNQTKAGLIDTFAHEFAHQWGAVDAAPNGPPPNPNDDASKIAAAAVAAYKADNGKKCGGL